jgi:hypothetical protein
VERETAPPSLTKVLLAVSASLAVASSSTTRHLYDRRQLETGSVFGVGVTFLSLTVGHNPSATVSVPVPRDSTNLPIDSEGTTWSFVAINTGICVVDLIDRSSIVLGGVNELSSDVIPPRAVVGVTCASG